MKHLKLFFALFAMLALGVTNAWGAEETVSLKDGTHADSKITWTAASGNITITQSKGSSSTAVSSSYVTAPRVYKGHILSFEAKEGYKIKQIDITYSGNYYGNSMTAGTVMNNSTTVTNNTTDVNRTWSTAKNGTHVVSSVSPDGLSAIHIQNVASTNVQLRPTEIKITYVEGTSTPATQYTIKWHTAKGVTTDVTLNEGATITKPATDPTMTDYEFMGWTASCDVASDGSDFTALTDFGTADSDKDFYAVFAKATTTGGGAATETTASVVIKDYASAKNWANGTKYTTVEVDANITATVTGGGNTGKYYTSGNEWRLYQSESAKLTISAKNDININTVKVTYNVSSSGVLKLNSTNVTSGTTVKDVNASSITFSVGNSGSATNGQVKVTAMEVVYTSGGGGTTTYDNYITTCASGIEYVELGDDFKWSATEAEVTIDATDNEFPTLKNTHNVPVTYSSSDDAIASIASDGTVTLNKEGTVTITAKYEGGISAGTGKEYKAKTVTYSLKVNKAAPVASGTTYVKVTSTAGITDGEYLIVYETGKVAFDGSLTSLDATKNTIDVEINNNTIAGTNYIDLSTFTIDATAGTIKSKSGYYIGKTATGNGLNTNQSTKYTNTITIDANKNAVVTSSGGPILRYNKAADQLRFRYFGSGQEAIALYKKASSHTLTYGTCTNGSVSADVADGATVLSGTTITLSNTPTTDYKLSAYDVYKTGDETTKVTVDGNTFVMPEFDVTISATFVPAKTLTSIEITSAATQTTFWQGETFNYTGLEVTAHFDGAADEVVTPTVTGSTATAGTQTVTVSFTEGTVTKTATYTITVKAIPNTKETAYTVADAYDIIDKLTTADGVYIKGIVSQVDEYLSNYKSITYWISDDGTTTKQLQAYSGKGLDGAEFSDINGVSKADQVIVCGDLKKHTDGTYEFNYNNYLVEHTKTTKADPELSYTTTEYNVNLGEAFTAPTLNNTHNLTVTYSSNNEDVAIVAADGAVTIKAAGTVVITASFAGNDDYVAGSASYIINITDPNQLEVTFDATIDSDANNTARGEGEITKAPITFACTDGILGNGSEYRIYANAKATFSAAEGYIITKIVLTSTASGTADNGPAHLDEEDGTYTYEEKVGTWVGEAYIVTLSASKQVRAKTITVYYKQDNRVDAGLAWNPATVSLTIGDAFTAPTFINPKNLAVSFESSNTELATVDNAGAISLVSGKTGTATITATYAGNETYKAAEVTCTIIVNHKSEDVVILAKCKDQYYAMVAEYDEGKTDVLQALPVEYVGGKIYNVETEDQASIIWKRSVVDGKTTFKNGDNYLSAVNSAALKLAPEACDWIFENDMYKIEGADRTILYYATTGGFKNYSIGNMSPDGVSGEYSSTAITVAPVFADGDAYHRTVTSGNYGTMCIPYGTSNYSGAKFYEVSWFETNNALWLDEVNDPLVAGKPYIFLATASEIAIIGDGTTADAPVAGVNGLTGTFTDIVAGDVTNNYIIAQNCIWVANEYNYVNAYRAYIKASDLPTTEQAQLPGRRRVCMGENVETGLDQIVAPEGQTVKAIVNGQLIIIRDGVKYNVQGQVIK